MTGRTANPTATIIAAWLTSGPAARVLALLNAEGEEARIVGGAVRNALLNLPVGEIDVATTALPEDEVRRARAAQIKCVPTGLEHGTVHDHVGGRADIEARRVRFIGDPARRI